MSIKVGDVAKSFKENDGFWETYPEDKDVKIKIRPLYPEKVDELQRKATSLDRAGNKTVDDNKYESLLRDYIIADWQGIDFEGDTSCTPENKETLSKYVSKVMKFILDKSSEIANDIVNQDEARLKNLKTTPGE